MKGIDKLKSAAKDATQKLPKPLRDKADKKLGLFIHKYIATLYYFDDEVQNIWWEMEEQAEKGYYYKAPEGEKTVSTLSDEMGMVIQIKNRDDYSGPDSRKHKKMTTKISEKMSSQADKIEEVSEKSPRKLYKMAKRLVGKDEIKPEDVEEEFNLEDLEEEED